MSTRVTQREVANRLGVSQGAVAFALSDSPHARRQLRSETRELIVQTANQMGYVPDHAARRLARSRSRGKSRSFDVAGLIYLGDPRSEVDPVFLAMMRGAEYELSKLHASLLFVRVNDRDDWVKVERLMRAGGVDGLLVYGPADDDVVGHLKPGHLPFVILGDHRCTQPVPNVNLDCTAVGHLAVQHLASLGHRRIAYLRCGMDFVYQQQTIAAFRAALKQFGLDDDDALIGREPYGEDLVRWYRRWLRETDRRPTALFTPESDGSGPLRFLKQAQIEVPNEISLLACDIVAPRPLAGDEGFTRIQMSMSEVGREGASLLRRLVSEPALVPERVKIPPTLIQGWSTCPPASGVPGLTQPIQNQG